MLILVFNLIFKALNGVYAKDVHVRMACLNAVMCIPAVANRSLPQNTEVATSIWVALHDPEKVCPPFPMFYKDQILLLPFILLIWNKPWLCKKCVMMYLLISF